MGGCRDNPHRDKADLKRQIHEQTNVTRAELSDQLGTHILDLVFVDVAHIRSFMESESSYASL